MSGLQRWNIIQSTVFWIDVVQRPVIMRYDLNQDILD